MKEVIKTLNTALLNLTWWKKPVLFILYPVLLVGTYLLWRIEGKLSEPQDGEGKTDEA